jgi:S-adenosylmethionine decarboxylase proenzyme
VIEILRDAATAGPARALGEHHLVEFAGCPRHRIATTAAVLPVRERAMEACGATVLGSRVHQFDPAGVTAVVLLSESHVALHTWPEHGYAALDVFTCGPMAPRSAVEEMARGFAATRVQVRVVRRGVPS